MRIKLYIEGEPTAKGRPRFSGSGHVYTPEKTELAEELIKAAFYTQGGQRFPANVPLKVECRFFLRIPKSASKKKQAEMAAHRLLPTKKPDTDNLLKLVLDALNGVAYVDDSQVCIECAGKWYSEKPHTEIRIEELEFI